MKSQTVCRILCILLSICLIINLTPSPAFAKYFADTYPGMLAREFFDAFNYVSDNGLMEGTDSSHFSPYTSITRAMFVTILYRYSNSTGNYSCSFNDVSSGAYYYRAVAWASHYGIVTGFTDSTFKPDLVITKEQIAVILYRYATNYEGRNYNTASFASISSHPDYSNVSPYAEEAFRWAKTYCIFTFLDSQYLNPLTNMNRAYAALFISNYSKNITGFISEDRFHFTNSDSGSDPAFRSTYFLGTNPSSYLYNRIDAYYENRAATAQNDKNIIKSKIGSPFSGACFGISICTLFDKLGKIDFNKNFGNNVATMSEVGKPRSYAVTVESAINYYQFLQYISDLSQARQYFNSDSLGAGVQNMYSYFRKYGPLSVGYFYKAYNSDGSYSVSGHAIILTNIVKNNQFTYTLTIIDPNSSNYSTPISKTLTVNGNMATLQGAELTALRYFPAEAIHLLDNFDLDGAYNNEDHLLTATVMSNNTRVLSEQTENTTGNAHENQIATLCLPYSPFRITNAAGQTLTFDERGLHGNMRIHKQEIIPTSPTSTADLLLTVDLSESFEYENFSAGHTSFCVTSSAGFGSVSGKGINRVSVDTNKKSIEVDGTNMEYCIWLDTGIKGYEHFYLKGTNSTAFSIAAKEQKVCSYGIVGEQECGFATRDQVSASTTTQVFKTESSLELSVLGETGGVVFSTTNNS